MSTNVIAVSGFRVCAAIAIKTQTLHMAWGTGDPAWDSAMEAASISDAALHNELGRKAMTQVAYVTPDDAGDIVLSNQTYSISSAATRHLYCKCVFEAAEESSATIREIGIFMNSIPASGHESDAYLLPANVQTPGIMMLEDRFVGVIRTPTNRELFEYVMTI